MKIKIKKLNPAAILPTKGSDGAAAFDVFLPKNTEIKSGRQFVPLGFAVEIPKGYCAKIFGRSGNTCKGMLGMRYSFGATERFDCNVELGLIDCDYRGEVSVLINNHGAKFNYIAKNAIAQMKIERVEEADFVIVDELGDTDRGEGGFGHSDKVK